MDKLTPSASFLSTSNATSSRFPPVSADYSHSFTQSPFIVRPVPHKPVAFVIGEQLAPLVEAATKVFKYVLSNLPSFTLPGASATTSAACPPIVCDIPKGPYQKSCTGIEVRLIPDEDECEVSATCATMFSAIPPQPTTIRFAPGVSSEIGLENRNGTLILDKSSREKIFNQKLKEASANTNTPQQAAKEQANIIGNLQPGDIITLSPDKYPIVVFSEKLPNHDGFGAFHRFAQLTGGIMALSQSPKQLPSLMRHMTSHMLPRAGAHQTLDVAIVIDTTKSMQPYIVQVKRELGKFLQDLQTEKPGSRVALIQFRDKGGDFIAQTTLALTSDLDMVNAVVQGLAAEGGGDQPEAVLDGLFEAQQLEWNQNAKRTVLLIGDAPPHPKTIGGAYGEQEILDWYQDAETPITVYPIFSGS